MAEETKEAPSFVPAAPPPPRRVRDRSSFSQSEAPLATEAPAATRGSLFSVASSGSRHSDADSTISFNYDDDDAEAPSQTEPSLKSNVTLPVSAEHARTGESTKPLPGQLQLGLQQSQ